MDFRTGLIAALLLAAPALSRGATLTVAPNGNDAWSGALATPNRAGTDGPLATLEGARDAIRKLKAAGALPAAGVAVEVRAGTYCLGHTFQLTAQDSGAAEAPVVYRAAPGERVVLSGGRPITGFVPYKGKILKADAGAQGFRGVYFRQLLFNGERQQLARYPNFDPRNPYGGGWAYADGKLVPMYNDIPGEDRRTLHYKASDERPWSRPDEGEVFVFARYNWWNNIVRIQSIDRGTRTITLAGDASYPIRPNDRYYVRNLFEELDAPGEWYLDNRDWTLFFIPPSRMGQEPVYAPVMRTIVEMGPGTAHVTLRGFTLECCEGTAVALNQTNDCLVAGNTIRNVGDYTGSGVSVSGGARNGVAGNDISYTGSHGIALSGGDRVTLTPCDNYADNNYIHHMGVFYKQGVGISMSGCGVRASHNLIHDGPRMGIMFSGNNLVIEYNHIRHVNLETEDTGAVYTGGRDWISSRGTVIRYNYFHDILGYGQTNGHWVSPHFAWGVYLDDNAGGVDVIGNIVARVPRAGMHLHNARDNLIENNILYETGTQQFECSGWTGQSANWLRHLPTMIQGYDSVMNQPAWKGMRNMDVHPTQAVLPDGLIMTGNVFRKNILCYHGPTEKLFRLSRVPFDHYESDYNLVWHDGKPLLIDGLGAVPAEKQWAEWQSRGKDTHSRVADPLFVDPEKGDFRLKPGSPAPALGFQPIPVEKIGPYRDELRASWPIREEEGAREHPILAESEQEAAAAPAAADPRHEKPFAVPRVAGAGIEGALLAGQGRFLELPLAETPGRTPIKGAACTARLAHDGETLYVAVVVPGAKAGLSRGDTWGQDDGTELCFRDASGRVPGPIFILHGFTGGKLESTSDGGAPTEAAGRLAKAARFAAAVADTQWSGLWAVPLAAAGIKPRLGLKLGFNLGVRRSAGDEWINWSGTLSQTWQVQNAGVLVLE